MSEHLGTDDTAVVRALRNLRLAGVAAMLCAVTAGALGYSDTVKLWLAACGVGAVILLKAGHVLK